ncbi:MAG TPA: CHASE3 domain-containing protein [Bryobacteraceae bacterium]|nr:CHASE3 domain-containing protein [Bryobacteraceae bacterium]
MKPSLKIRQEAERLSLLIALLLVLFTAILTYRAWAAFERNRQEAQITRQVVDGTTALLSSLKDAEAGQRGFLLTGSDRYLEPYRQALVEIPANLDAIAHAEASGRQPRQIQRIDRLKPLVQSKMNELAQTIELRRSQGLDPALAIVRSDRGQAAMEQIRAICTEIQAASYERLGQQREEVRASAYQAGVTSLLGSAAVFALLVLATVTIRRGTRQRQLLIEDLQKSEEQAKESRDLLQTTIASIGDGVITTDTAGRVVSLNPIAQSLTGWPQDQAVGKPLEEIFNLANDETGAAAGSPVRAALRAGRITGLTDRTTLTAKDGRRISIDDSAAPIRSANGRVTGAVLVFRDVTQRRGAELLEKKAAAEIARHSELLERTNAELQHFAYAASHDLREPLRTITAYTQLVQLRSRLQIDTKSAECLQFIVAAAERMGLLIDALLDYSKAGEVTHRPLSVLRMEEVLASAIGNLNGSIEENKAVVTHDPLPAIMGDRTHLEQLIQNLIGNALKYRRQEVPLVHIAARESGKEWLFSISDNGQGIAPQYQTQIFELFKRLHGQQYPGSGIGLATCKRLVERYGGRIWVESEAGKGSTFFFTLPATAEFHKSASV